MKEEILKLQEEGGETDWSNPSNEQLINIF